MIIDFFALVCHLYARNCYYMANQGQQTHENGYFMFLNFAFCQQHNLSKYVRMLQLSKTNAYRVREAGLRCRDNVVWLT